MSQLQHALQAPQMPPDLASLSSSCDASADGFSVADLPVFAIAVQLPCPDLDSNCLGALSPFQGPDPEPPDSFNKQTVTTSSRSS
mmetsp:Transcript_28757/g.45098  ORF Transcript_28757/g.45098 Transcript_28757/m.45098 type:complete len:85 (+) Transcript_28757:249-503(+)